jgi:hypothetical protein
VSLSNDLIQCILILGLEQRKSLEQAPRIVNAAERFGKLLEGEFYAFADDIDDDALSIVESALGMLKKIDKQASVFML